MLFEIGKYYHLYNRSNNQETVFPFEENYHFFLGKISTHLVPHCSILSYCLMPTHFHFLVRIETENSKLLSDQIAIMLRSYTRAINKRYKRNGSLFQQNTKAKLIRDEAYLITLMNYIHQNPLRAKLVSNIEDWVFSSYQTLSGKKGDGISNDYFLRKYFKTSAAFEEHSRKLVESIKKEYWI